MAQTPQNKAIHAKGDDKYQKHTKNASAPGGFMDKGEPKGSFSSKRQGTSDGYMKRKEKPMKVSSLTEVKSAKDVKKLHGGKTDADDKFMKR